MGFWYTVDCTRCHRPIDVKVTHLVDQSITQGERYRVVCPYCTREFTFNQFYDPPLEHDIQFFRYLLETRDPLTELGVA